MTWTCAIFFLACGSVLATDPKTIFNANGKYKMEIGENVSFTFYSLNGSTVVLNAHHTSSIFKTNGPFKRCKLGNNELDVCVNWGEHIVNISVISENCLRVENSQPTVDHGEVSVCFPYEDKEWYGGPQRFHQDWPVQSAVLKDTPFLTGYDSQYIAEPFWFNSAGASIYVFPDVPLFWDSNANGEKKLCLKARSEVPYIPTNVTNLRYEVCVAANAVDIQRNAVTRYFGKPADRPYEPKFEDPIYSTILRFGSQLTQENLTQLVSELQNYSFPIGVIHVDRSWESCLGESKFDVNRFPSIRNFTDAVRKLGGKVSASIHPYIGQDCQPAYKNALSKKRFIIGDDSKVEVEWNQIKSSILDFSQPEVSSWYIEKIRDLQYKAGIEFFKFELGSAVTLPQIPKLTGNVFKTPDYFIKKYGEIASNITGFITVGRNTQTLPSFTKLPDMDVFWGLDNGLQGLIPSLFQMNLAGYPFVISEIIGGSKIHEDLDKELFIRWLQATTFMPIIQFSRLPWDFDTETVEISRELLALHNIYTNIFQSASDKAVNNGTPINTPIWWIAPEDKTALQCNDEYLLAETILVAPVLIKGATQRDIYLPQGKWYNTKIGTIEGPKWVRNFSAPLNTLPYFVKDGFKIL